MKNKIIKCTTALLVMLSLVIIPITTIKAAASISISGVPGSVQPGATFTVTVSIPGYLGGTVTLTGSNCSISPSTIMIDGSATFTVQAGSAGGASISAYSPDATNASDLSTTTASGSASFTVVAPNTGGGSGSNSNSGSSSNSGQTNTQKQEDTRSTNANLASLSVSEGSLTPEFNADTTEYAVSLAADVTKIKVDAKAADEKASVSGAGEIEVNAGENRITVTVTAENGTKKNYVIIATVDEKPEVYVTYNKTKLGVVRNLAGVTAPEGFEETNVTIDGKETKAWVNNAMKTTIVYLVDEKTGEKNFYIYDTKAKNVTSLIKPAAILGNNVYIVDIAEKDQKLEGFKYTKVKIDNTELMGWEFEDSSFKNYSLIYVMDGNGKMQYYQYEKTQNTLQLYSKAAPVSQESYEKLVSNLNSADTMKLIFMILTGVFAITTIAGAVMIVKLRSNKN